DESLIGRDPDQHGEHAIHARRGNLPRLIRYGRQHDGFNMRDPHAHPLDGALETASTARRNSSSVRWDFFCTDMSFTRWSNSCICASFRGPRLRASNFAAMDCVPLFLPMRMWRFWPTS